MKNLWKPLTSGLVMNDLNIKKDNLYTLQSYMSKNFNMDNATFCSQFEIPEELDYVS